jgi:uncharacterized protein YbaR (Trm112 family)
MKRIICYLFGHQYRISRRITSEITELFCYRCKNQFAIHTGVKTLLPLDMELFEMHNEILMCKKLKSEQEQERSVANTPNSSNQG